MFRFPKDLLEKSILEAYCIEDGISVEIKDKFLLLDLCFRDEEWGGDWIEGEEWLAPMFGLRDEILHGDYRSVYIAWLAIARIMQLDESTLEPPVPAGLDQLSPAHETLIELFELDKDILKAASQASSDKAKVELSDQERLMAIKAVPQSELDEILLNLAKGKANLSLELNRRVEAASVKLVSPKVSAEKRRSLKEIYACARIIKADEDARSAKVVAEQRLRELEKLALIEPQTWAKVYSLIEEKKTSA